jgi:hypothetical protein
MTKYRVTTTFDLTAKFERLTKRIAIDKVYEADSPGDALFKAEDDAVDRASDDFDASEVEIDRWDNQMPIDDYEHKTIRDVVLEEPTQ